MLRLWKPEHHVVAFRANMYVSVMFTVSKCIPLQRGVLHGNQRRTCFFLSKYFSVNRIFIFPLEGNKTKQKNRGMFISCKASEYITRRLVSPIDKLYPEKLHE